MLQNTLRHPLLRKFKPAIRRNVTLTYQSDEMRDYSTIGSSSLGKPLEEIQIPVPWGHICGKWWGCRDAVPLVALHGFTDSSGSFDRLVPHVDVPAILALDHPGHGKSSHLPRGACYQLADFVLALQLVVKHFGWQKVSILGHSFGSVVGMAYAACYPEEVHSFISVDSARFFTAQLPAIGPPSVRLHVDRIVKHAKSHLDNAPAYKWEDLVTEYEKATCYSVDRQHVGLILSRNVAPHPRAEGFVCSVRDARFKISQGMMGLPDFDMLLEYIRNVKCHVMEVYCSESVKPPQEYARSRSFLAERRKEQELLFRESAMSYEPHDVIGTHHVHLNSPELIAPLINNFIRRVTTAHLAYAKL